MRTIEAEKDGANQPEKEATLTLRPRDGSSLNIY